jgi:hypothetical protein
MYIDLVSQATVMSQFDENQNQGAMPVALHWHGLLKACPCKARGMAPEVTETLTGDRKIEPCSMM